MTSASDFDQASYLRDVIETAVARQLAPRDLLIRYAITGECARSPSGLPPASGRGGEVLALDPAAATLQEANRRADGGARRPGGCSGQLTYSAFVRRRDEDRARALEHLETRACDLAAMTEVAGPDMLDALRAETGWLLPDGDVRVAVRRHGVSIADELWKLPPRPDTHCRGLAEPLMTLGLTLVAEAVFDAETVRGGFRLRNGFRLNSGDQLTAAVIDQKKQRMARSPLGTRKTAMENVLTTLQAAAAQPGGLDQLLLWQLIDALEARLAAGYFPVSLARAARELGLDPVEAPMLALAVYTWRQPARGALRKEVEAALQSRSHPGSPAPDGGAAARFRHRAAGSGPAPAGGKAAGRSRPGRGSRAAGTSCRCAGRDPGHGLRHRRAAGLEAAGPGAATAS